MSTSTPHPDSTSSSHLNLIASPDDEAGTTLS
jgi:hypothetical protein